MIKFFCASNDPAMLKQNVIGNPFVSKHSVEIEFDQIRAKGLPERYNAFIEKNLDSDAWLVFIHDDVELLEDITDKLETLPKDIIYGVCGAKKDGNGKGEIVGQILCQDPRCHSGNKFMFGRRVAGYEIVPTFDPFCIIVHTDVFQWRSRIHKITETGFSLRGNYIRFDEALGYHLHSEEMSINAKMNYDINSAVIQLNLCHYSWGTLDQSYNDAIEHIQQKHGIEKFICTPKPNCMDESEKDDWE